MKKERRHKHFIKKPVYPGGMKAMRAFIKKEMIYPPEALKNGIEGSVPLKYQVNHLGKVIDVKTVSSLGYGCDEEAIRLVKLLKFEVEKMFKTRVTFNKTIRVWFKRPTKQETKPSLQINYQTVAKKSDDKKSGYSYTVNLDL